MSQATLTIDDSKGGAEYTIMLNAALLALASAFSGTTAPAEPMAGKWWADTSVAGTITLKMYDGAAWRSIFAINTETGVVTPAGLGTAAFKNTGTSAGNVVMLDEAGKLPAIDGSQLTSLPTLAADQTARDMAVLNAFDIAELQGSAIRSLGSAVVDAFEDTSGVDLATSTGESHNAAGGYFSNLATTASGTAGQAQTATASLDPGNGSRGGMQFTAAQSGTISEATFSCGTVVTPGDCHVELWTDVSGSPGAKIGASSGTVNISTLGVKTFTWSSGPSVVSGTVYWIVLVAEGAGNFTANFCNAVAGYKSCRSNTITSMAAGSEVNPTYDWIFGFTIGSLGDMALVSEALTAASAPSTARVTLDHEDVSGSATLNTDVKFSVSRDDGVTWTTAVLAALRDAGSGRKVYVADVDLSAQPSGTSVRLKGEQLNSKVGKWHRWAVQTDVPLAA